MKRLITILVLAAASATTAQAVQAGPQAMIVRAITHRINEHDYVIMTPGWVQTNCFGSYSSINCNSTGSPAQANKKAVYYFSQLVVDEPTNTAYTLGRSARWVWSNLDWLNDGDYFPAQIKGGDMLITYRHGGNQGKQETVKFQILDIRPWNNGSTAPRPKAEPNPTPLAAAQAVQIALNAAPSPAPAAETGSVLVKSTPDGADISIDGQFVGNTPSALNLPAGEHTVSVSTSGFKTWQRKIALTQGSNVTLNASLEKSQ